MTDQATSLDDAINPAPDTTPDTTPEPVQEATQEATPEPTPEPPKAEPKAEPAPEMVPVGVVQELRRELRELKQAQAPRPQPPEFIDPEGAQFMQQQMTMMQANFAAELSEVKARSSYGSDVVDEAYKTAEAAGVLDQFKGKHDPWGELTKWHRQQKVMQEVGDDPSAYKARLEAEIRKQVEAEMVAKQAAAIAGTPAPSMAHATGTGGGTRTTWSGPTPLNNILGD